MAEEIKSTLTEEEKIARKVKIRRIISYIFMIIAGISVVAFVILAYLTKGNIETQITFDTQELRSKLKNIINLEIQYYKENGEYAEIKFNQLCKEIEKYNPNVAGSFKYSFDPETLIATGMEKDYQNDVNEDEDGRDGLTLSVNWEPGVQKGTSGGDFFWADEDLAYFEEKRAQLGSE
ncbi:hypothetical protein ACFL6H_05385 [Candidatus Latescibacterota bacterium]